MRSPILRTFVSNTILQNSYRLNSSKYFTSYESFRNSLPILAVPQNEAWIVERFGKFSRILSPGINFLAPFIERVAYVQCLKELTLDIADQSTITLDNAVLNISAVLSLIIRDPFKASYAIHDAETAIKLLAQTTMRSEVGKLALDSLLREREGLNSKLVKTMNSSSSPWGIECLRYEIKDISFSEKILEAMQIQLEAERRKRALIIESEGKQLSEINRAFAKSKVIISDSEAAQAELVNIAFAQAKYINKVAESHAKAINDVALVLQKTNCASEAAQYNLSEKYIEAFSKIVKTSNTIVLPTNSGDVISLVTQALAVYKNNADNLQKVEDKQILNNKCE